MGVQACRLLAFKPLKCFKASWNAQPRRQKLPQGQINGFFWAFKPTSFADPVGGCNSHRRSGASFLRCTQISFGCLSWRSNGAFRIRGSSFRPSVCHGAQPVSLDWQSKPWSWSCSFPRTDFGSCFVFHSGAGSGMKCACDRGICWPEPLGSNGNG